MGNILDIIIPEYNCPEEHIKRLLNSINIQKNIDFKEIGIIIVNDSSKKKLRKGLFKNYPKLNIKYYVKDKNEGQGLARQYGLDNSTAKYVTFIDQDDIFNIYDRTALAKTIDCLKNNDYNVLVTNFIAERLVDGQLEYKVLKFHSSHLKGKYIKREAFEKFDVKFHPMLRQYEDSFVLTTLLLQTGYMYLDVTTQVWKYNKNSQTNNAKVNFKTEYFEYFYIYVNDAYDFLLLKKVKEADAFFMHGLYGLFLTLEMSELNDCEKEKREKMLYELYSKNKSKFDSFSRLEHLQFLSDEYKTIYNETPNSIIEQYFEKFVDMMSKAA